MYGRHNKQIFPVATCKCYSGNLYTEGIRESIKFCNNFKENHSAVNVLSSMYLCCLGEYTIEASCSENTTFKSQLKCKAKKTWIHFVCVQTHSALLIILECQANTFDHRVMVLLRRITNTSTGINFFFADCSYFVRKLEVTAPKDFKTVWLNPAKCKKRVSLFHLKVWSE